MIALWMASLDRSLLDVEIRRLTDALPEWRRERLERLKRTEWRREPLCAYWLLRLALRECCGWHEFPDMAHTPSGKPYFSQWPDVHFSISHTDGAVMVGLADREIGVDIERLRPVKEQMLRRFDCDSEEAFFEMWTRREARAKRSASPVELGGESPLQPREQIVYPKCFPGYTACADWLGEEVPDVRRLTMEELLRN